MSVKYSWNRQNGAAMPSVRFMSIEPAEDYYKGMPLKLKEKGIVEPTDGDPEYICMAEYNPDAEIQPLEIPVQEVFPDVVYNRMNDDGTIEEVRFGSKGGGGGDLLETVEGVVELAFDGTLEGKEYKEISADGIVGYLVKMSDDIPAIDDLIYYHVAAQQEDHIGEVTEDVIEDGSVTGIIGYTVGRSILVITEPCEAQGVLLSPGIWFSAMDGSIFGGTGWIGGFGLTYNSTKTQLKPSLLPSHKHKWDDIEDAICWDRSTSEPLNITFDGDVSNYESVMMQEGMYMVKVSDTVLSLDQIIGSTMVATAGTNEASLVLSSDTVIDLSDTDIGIPTFFVQYDDLDSGIPFMAYFMQRDFSEQGVTLTAGVWVLYGESDAGSVWVKSITNPNVTITTGELKKIDNKFIDAEWMAKENILTELTFDGNSAGHETIFDGLSVKISDRIFTEEELTGCVISMVSPQTGNPSFEGVPEYISNYGRIDIEAPDGFNYAVVYLENNSEGVSPGLYVVCGNGIYVSSIKFANPISDIVPLPEKFMPELTQLILKSTTEGSEKKFRVTVDDTGALTAVEITS